MFGSIRSAATLKMGTRFMHSTSVRMSYPVSKTGKPLPPYIRFFQEVRPTVIKSNPNLLTKEVAREIGAKWRELSEAERQRYKDEYRKVKDESK